MPISNDLAGLVGMVCEAMFYGAYCILFIISSNILLFDRRRERNVPMIIANCALFLLCSAHFGLEFHHFHLALNTNGVKGFGNETNLLFGADILVGVTDFVGDMVLLYRCWLVWEKQSYIVVLPFLTSLAGFASYMESLHLLLVLSPTASVAPKSIVPLATAGFILPLCTNIMVTSLIVGRIWYKTQDVRSAPSLISDTARVTNRAMSIVIESGALYLTIQVIFVALFSLRHAAQGIVVPVAVQIYGIAPTLIIIRVALGVSYEQTTGVQTRSKISWAPRPGHRHHTTMTTTTGGDLTSHTDGSEEGMQLDVVDVEGGLHGRRDKKDGELGMREKSGEDHSSLGNSNGSRSVY